MSNQKLSSIFKGWDNHASYLNGIERVKDRYTRMYSLYRAKRSKHMCKNEAKLKKKLISCLIQKWDLLKFTIYFCKASSE